MSDRSPDLETGATRMAETRARQGFRDRPVLIVLAVSLLLAVLAVFGIMLWQPNELRSMNADAGRDRRDAESYNQTMQPPKGD